MPLKRTPPSTSSSSPLQHCLSEPSLNKDSKCVVAEVGTLNVTCRPKRRRSPSEDIGERLASFMTEIKDILDIFKLEQNLKLEELSVAVSEIKRQNNEIQSSVEFLSQKYDSIVCQIEKLELERQKDQQQIQLLQSKIENYERLSRATCVEIKNIPPSHAETKDNLLSTVTSIGKHLNVPIQPHEIKDVFRINTRDSAARTVVVDFTGVMMKERIIRMYRRKNRENNRLTTEKLGFNGPSKPIYISESLSPKMKRLFYLSRDFAKSNEYSHCWISNGKILLRKKEGESFKIIKDEDDLSVLRAMK